MQDSYHSKVNNESYTIPDASSQIKSAFSDKTFHSVFQGRDFVNQKVADYDGLVFEGIALSNEKNVGKETGKLFV